MPRIVPPPIAAPPLPACSAVAVPGLAIVLAFALLLAPGRAGAEAPVQPLGLGHCAAVPADAERLACYDRLAGRPPPAPTRPPSLWGRALPGPPPTASSLVPVPADPAAAIGAVPPPAGGGLQLADTSPATSEPGGEAPSIWSTFWELSPQDKRGTFNFKTYRPNFLLPLHHTTDINRQPSSPTRPPSGTDARYKPLEAKLQISLRTKIAQGLVLPGGDLWFGYTQQSLWQVWNPSESAPFRNTDFEPELIYVLPVPEASRQLPWGWQLRMLQAGVAHQSNGQSEPLSRSWNRSYVAAGLERGEFTLFARLHKRLNEGAADDDNPDLTRYVGRGDIAMAWLPGAATASLRWRTALRNFNYGSWQLDWTYPVDRSKPDGLRWYVQVFTGYGESLLDYNFRQTSVGFGLTLFEF